MSLQLDERYQDMVRAVLKDQQVNQKVYVYGSRATQTARKFSDLDLCLVGDKLNFLQLASLKEAFSESDLPYFVDVVDANRVSGAFYDRISKDFVEFV